MSFVYEIAQNRQEAEELAAKGFGYNYRRVARAALKASPMDDFYRKKLRVYRIRTAPRPFRKARTGTL